MRRGGSLARETAADAGNQRRVAIRRQLRICGDLAPLRWQVNDALHAWSPPPVAAAATAAVAAATGTAAASTALAPCPPAPSQPWLSRRSMQPPQPPIPLPPLHVASAAATAQSAFLTYPWPPRKGRAGPYSPRATSFAHTPPGGVAACAPRRLSFGLHRGGLTRVGTSPSGRSGCCLRLGLGRDRLGLGRDRHGILLGLSGNVGGLPVLSTGMLPGQTARSSPAFFLSLHNPVWLNRPSVASLLQPYLQRNLASIQP